MIAESNAHVAMRAVECLEPSMYFTRLFMKERTGSKMLLGAHHQIINDTLERVYNGEITRLIINLPPGYTKTEQATIHFAAKGIAKNPRARFMLLSYSDKLCMLNSSSIRNIVKSKKFQSMWPIAIRNDSDSKSMWWTEQNGGVYAASSKGQVTGFRAGHMEEGFNGALIIDDPVKPDDAFSEVERGGVNNRFNETIKSRLAVETTPIIVIMQRIHYDDLSGYLLRGGSGEKWHHLNLPVFIDNSLPYPPEYTHGVPIPHNLPDGWLWPAKHTEAHRGALMAHRRTFEAQYMQRPRKFDQEGALWLESMISQARELGKLVADIQPKRTVIAIDPAGTNNKDSDETGITVCNEYLNNNYSVSCDATGKYSPEGWGRKAIELYKKTNADAIVFEANNGGDMGISVLRLLGFKGRIIKVHASKGKFARAEPISALYAQGKVAHIGDLYELESQYLEYVPLTAKNSPDRLDSAVWGLTELSNPSKSALYTTSN